MCTFFASHLKNFRAFPNNAVTMGVVTFIMKAFGEKDLTAYEAMKRTRQADVVIDLHPVIEQYFEKRNIGMAYHHNISTIATDGCNILHIARPAFTMSKTRLYVENMYYAMPTYVDESEVSIPALTLYAWINYLLNPYCANGCCVYTLCTRL